jgi:hypothetical protein
MPLEDPSGAEIRYSKALRGGCGGVVLQVFHH